MLRPPPNEGKDLEAVITDHKLCLLNDRSSTYLHPATGTYSSIDLSICSPSLLLDFDWKVGDDLCGSDHFPILLANLQDLPEEDFQRWKLNKADWDYYQLYLRAILHKNFLKMLMIQSLYSQIFYRMWPTIMTTCSHCRVTKILKDSMTAFGEFLPGCLLSDTRPVGFLVAILVP